MSLEISTSSSTEREITAARQADSVAFLHRAPFTLDAYKLDFLPGFREDCGYQQTQFKQLDIPVGMLDNDFRNPDLDRYVVRFFEHEPQVGVIGDAYEGDDVDEYVAAAREIRASYPDAELVIVPKCREVIDAIPNDIVLGYSRGYADRLARLDTSRRPPRDRVRGPVTDRSRRGCLYRLRSERLDDSARSLRRRIRYWRLLWILQL